MLKIEIGKNNPILRQKTQPIELAYRRSRKIDEDVLNLIKEMMKTMIGVNGIGLSANQVGKNIQLFVINPELSKKCVFINPEIIKISKKSEIIEEGCLSLPDIFIPTKRAKSIKIKAINEKNKQFKLKAKGLLARAIQHEIDHLNGILICDKHE